jgi:hypothetical protein
MLTLARIENNSSLNHPSLTVRKFAPEPIFNSIETFLCHFLNPYGISLTIDDYLLDLVFRSQRS